MDPDGVVPCLSIRLLGNFEVMVHNTPLPPLRSRKEKWLLALLVLQKGREVSRDWLAQTLWPFPEHATDQARAYLRRSLWQIGQGLGSEAYRVQRPTNQTLRFD